MHVQEYLNFDGRCEEAIEFYKKSLGAQVDMMMRMKEAPEQSPDCPTTPATENKIMHSAFRIGDTQVMATDGYSKGQAKFDGISLSLSAKDSAEANRVFNALADGGKVQMPLTKTFFSDNFGMVSDRFGVSWLVIVPRPM